METERLVLRKAVDSDLNSIYRNVWSDESLSEYMLWEPTRTLDEAAERLERTIRYQSNNDAWFICLKETDEPIGFIGMVQTDDNTYDGTGLCIAKKYQGMGYGKEALKRLLSCAFTAKKASEFIYSVWSTNIRSKNLAKSLGFQYQYSEDKIRDYDGKAFINEIWVLDMKK